MKSVLTLDQKRVFRKDGVSPLFVITAELRYDDRCRNGHNTFAATADLYEAQRISGEATITHMCGKTCWQSSGGCMHEEISKHFPELRQYLKWHLCSSDGPMHYAANAHYWRGSSGYCRGGRNDPPNLEFLKHHIIFGEGDEWDENISDDWLLFQSPLAGFKEPEFDKWLQDRLPAVMKNFRAAMLSLGFNY